MVVGAVVNALVGAVVNTVINTVVNTVVNTVIGAVIARHFDKIAIFGVNLDSRGGVVAGNYRFSFLFQDITGCQIINDLNLGGSTDRFDFQLCGALDDFDPVKALGLQAGNDLIGEGGSRRSTRDEADYCGGRQQEFLHGVGLS